MCSDRRRADEAGGAGVVAVKQEAADGRSGQTAASVTPQRPLLGEGKKGGGRKQINYSCVGSAETCWRRRAGALRRLRRGNEEGGLIKPLREYY